MSISYLLDQGTCPPPWLAVRAHRVHSCTDIQFDRDLIGTLRLNGNIPPGGPRTFLHTDTLGVINWKTFDRADIPAGANGDYLQTIGGLVEWAPPSFSPSVISPGLANQIFHTDTTGTVAEWTSNIIVPGTFRVNSSSTFDANIDCNSVVNVDGNFFANADSNLVDVDIGGDLSFMSNSGTVGQVLTKTGATTQDWKDLTTDILTPGLANQILHTDQTGTVAEWTSDIEVPGDLKINGDTDIVSDLQFNGSSGTSGQYLVKTGATTQSWQNLSVSTNSITAGADYTVLTSAGGSALWITPSVVNQIKYGTTFLAQNINAAAGPTALQFSTSTFIDSAISNVGVPVNITQPSATEFTIGTSSVYNIDITGYVHFTPDGLGNPVVTLSLEVAGTEKTDYCIVCSDNYSFSGRFPAVFITAGQNIRVLARRVFRDKALTTFANGLPAPSFASSILIST